MSRPPANRQDPATTPVEHQVPEASNVPVTGAPAPEAPFDVDAAWNGLDERARTGIAERLYSQYNSQIQEQYGDIIPLVEKAYANPKLRSSLKEFASDDELLNFIADGGTIEQIRGLQKDPAYREFLFKDATEAYRKYPAQNAPVEDPMAPVLSRINSLESQLTERDQREAFTGYIGNRKNEIEALRNVDPLLREMNDIHPATGRKYNALLEHIVTQAEERFKIAAANSGINVGQKDEVWAAQAVRAGIRPPTYLDTFQNWQRVSGKTPPPAAPTGSAPVRTGRGAQAPRTRVEASTLTAQQRRDQTIAQMKQRSLAAVKK